MTEKEHVILCCLATRNPQCIASVSTRAVFGGCGHQSTCRQSGKEKAVAVECVSEGRVKLRLWTKTGALARQGEREER